jgi:hypothetical protein
LEDSGSRKHLRKDAKIDNSICDALPFPLRSMECDPSFKKALDEQSC